MGELPKSEDWEANAPWRHQCRQQPFPQQLPAFDILTLSPFLSASASQAVALGRNQRLIKEERTTKQNWQGVNNEGLIWCREGGREVRWM